MGLNAETNHAAYITQIERLRKILTCLHLLTD